MSFRMPPPDPQTAERRMDETMYYLRRLAMQGFTGYFPFRMVDGRVDRSTWTRIVHAARAYLAEEEMAA